jgi:hypothetical protein
VSRRRALALGLERRQPLPNSWQPKQPHTPHRSADRGAAKCSHSQPSCREAGPPGSGAACTRSTFGRLYTGHLRKERSLAPCRGELFGVAPVPPGQANIAVEQAADSSRNFVL